MPTPVYGKVARRTGQQFGNIFPPVLHDHVDQLSRGWPERRLALTKFKKFKKFKLFFGVKFKPKGLRGQRAGPEKRCELFLDRMSVNFVG